MVQMHEPMNGGGFMISLTDLEQEIIKYMQSEITLGNKISLTDVAKNCHVAPSTIIKLSKKIGYSGFVEMYYQMSHQYQTSHQISFQDDLIEGDLFQTLHQLALKIKECENRKNIISSSREGDPLAYYFSRKLQMMDVFAPASYDYNMVKSRKLKAGIAFFFFKDINMILKYSMIFDLALKENYYIVVVTESEANYKSKYIDMYINIKKTQYKTADFFMTKVIIFMEMLLSEYAKISFGERQNERN